MPRSRLSLLLCAAAVTAVAATARQPPAALQLRYIANAGVLARVGDRHFLIDAPIRDGIAPYPTSPADERVRLEQARPPYADIDAVLITHWHEDHFSAEAVAAHLTRNPKAVLISSPEVVGRVQAAQPLPSSRLRAVLPAPGDVEVLAVSDVPVRVLRIRHNPTRRLPEQHVGFLVGERTTILHVGDADPRADNFAMLAKLPPVDLAVLPFWYVLDQANRAFVSEAIRPRRVFAMHLPAADAPQVAARLAAARVTVALPTAPGATVTLP